MKFIAIGFLFALLLVHVSSRVVPVWSTNTTKNVEVGKPRAAKIDITDERAKLVSEYLQIIVPNLMKGKTGNKPQNGFYWLAPQTINTSPKFENSEWFNSQIANDVLIAQTQKLPKLRNAPAWIPDSNSNLGLAGVTKPEVGNTGHSEYKLIATSAGMWQAYISLNQQRMPPAVVLGTRRDPCCAPPGVTTKMCTQTYIGHVQAMRQQYKLKPGDTKFFIYVHCPPDPSSGYYKFWARSKILFKDEDITILEGTCN